MTGLDQERLDRIANYAWQGSLDGANVRWLLGVVQHLREQLEAANGRLDAVRALHRPRDTWLSPFSDKYGPERECGNCGETFPGKHIVDQGLIHCPRHTAADSLTRTHPGFIAECDLCAVVAGGDTTEPDDSFVEWAVAYPAGVHGCDDQAHAEEWQQWLAEPNQVVSRVVTRGPWLPCAGGETGDKQ